MYVNALCVPAGGGCEGGVQRYETIWIYFLIAGFQGLKCVTIVCHGTVVTRLNCVTGLVAVQASGKMFGD
jgi:hypothetical protein